MHMPYGQELWGWETLELTRYFQDRLSSLTTSESDNIGLWRMVACILWVTAKIAVVRQESPWVFDDCLIHIFQDEAEVSIRTGLGPHLMQTHGLNFITPIRRIKMHIEEQLFSDSSVQVSWASKVQGLYLTWNCVGQKCIYREHAQLSIRLPFPHLIPLHTPHHLYRFPVPPPSSFY